MQEIKQFDAFADWHSRISLLPRQMILDTFKRAATVGVDVAVAIECADLLIARRKSLPSIFRAGVSQFPKYQPGLFDPFIDNFCDYYFPEYSI